MGGLVRQLKNFGRKLLLGGFLLFTFASISSPAQAAGGCAVKDEHSIAMPPERKQGYTGLCYTFAATQLLQHYYCENKKGGCSYAPGSQDLISTLGVAAIANYGEGAFNSGGYPDEVLSAVNYSQRTPRESCAPFTKIAESNKLAPVASWGILGAAYQASYQTREKGQPCDRREMAEALRDVLQLQADIGQIQSALGYRNLQVYLGKVLIAGKCQSNQIEIPRFTSAGKSIHLPFAEIKSLILQKVSEGRPLNVNLCARDSDVFCGPHAIVVSGTRSVCCGGRCEAQYRVIDSGDAFGKERDAQGWVKAETLDKRIKLFQNVAGRAGSNSKIINWIEAKK